MTAPVSTPTLSRLARRLLKRLTPNNVMLGPLDEENVAAMQELLDLNLVRKCAAFRLAERDVQAVPEQEVL